MTFFNYPTLNYSRIFSSASLNKYTVNNRLITRLGEKGEGL